MAVRDSTVMQLRVDESLKQAFAQAAQRERITSADMLRRLMEEFIRGSKLREAQRQSRLVAAAADADDTMDAVLSVQGFDER